MHKKIEEYKDFYLPVSIVLAALIIGGAMLLNTRFSLGSLDRLLKPFEALQKTTSQTDTSNSKGSVSNIPVSSQDHIRGNASAPVTIVEFSDLQCPYCNAFHPTLKQALQEYGDKVRWVYKQFPLEQIHPYARPASEASECVWEQKGNDGFWKFADAVFQDQSKIGPDLFKQVAQGIGVNMDQFNSCVSLRKYKDKVQADIDLGTKLGVNGTPSSFINGVILSGAVPYSQLKQAIDAQLKK